VDWRNKNPANLSRLTGSLSWGESQQPTLKVCRKPVTVSGQNMINKQTRSEFDNMVLLIAKNFQLVKFSQVDLGIKTNHPAGICQRDTK